MNLQSESNPSSNSQLPIDFQSQFDSTTTTTMVGYSVYLKNRKKWLEPLLKGKFFVTCDEHEHLKKNDKNAFCIDCKQVLCQHCITRNSHTSHQWLQIRRYVYHNVVNLTDMEKYFDCSKLQLYILNSAKVVFLNSRPQPKLAKSGCNCETCGRQLSDFNRYCSIACKIAETMDGVTTGNSPGSLSFGRNWSSSENLELFEEHQEEDENEYLEYVDTNQNEEDEESDHNLKPKRRRNEESDHNLNPKRRRKGIPHRAPFF